jgi:DnaD/phage-associated family protein
MSEERFVLPGPENITISGSAAQKLINAGDGVAALLYLYILKNRSIDDLPKIAGLLGKSVSEIEAAMTNLHRLGLVRREVRPRLEDDETPEYTHDDIRRELENGAVFKQLVCEVQKSLGKILSSSDLIKLFNVYDHLGLPPEVILQLVTYCVEENHRKYGPGKMPTLRYIEKVAYTWESEGILSLEKAEEYLKKLYERRSLHGEVKKVLQISGRELSATERRYVDGWLSLGYGADIIELAYDMTVVKTGKLTWPYMDTIISNWYNSNYMSPEDIINSGRPQKPGRNPAKSSRAQDVAAPSGDFEKAKKLLDKLKSQ